MKKKGVVEVISIILLIMIAVIIIGILIVLTMSFLEKKEEETRLRGELQNLDMKIDDVYFNQTDNQRMSLVLSKGPGMQILVNLTNETVVYEVTEIIVETRTEPDFFSIVELSGSMNQNIPSLGKKVLEVVKEANEVFIYAVMESAANRLGFVGYTRDAEDTSQHHDLSRYETSLNATIYSWKAGEGTCTCCGINKAIEYFEEQSTEEKYKVMVLMSDGKANEACWTSDAKEDAKNAACNAYNDHEIIVHVIGVGPKSTIEEDPLKNISECGHGNYYYSSYEDLAETYRQIAKDVHEVIVEEYTIEENVTKEVYESRESYGYLKVLIYTSENTFVQQINVSDLPAPLETKEINIELNPLWGITTDDVEKVEIYAVSVNEDGEEIISLDPISVWERPSSY